MPFGSVVFLRSVRPKLAIVKKCTPDLHLPTYRAYAYTWLTRYSVDSEIVHTSVESYLKNRKLFTLGLVVFMSRINLYILFIKDHVFLTKIPQKLYIFLIVEYVIMNFESKGRRKMSRLIIKSNYEYIWRYQIRTRDLYTLKLRVG